MNYFVITTNIQPIKTANAPPSLLFTEVNTWPWLQRATIQTIDWHGTRLDQQFDIIVGSDIVYDRVEVAPLDRFFRQHLKPGGKIVLGDPNRPMTREFLAMFRTLAWKLQEETVHVDGVAQPIRIVSMKS